jgi:sugar-specific transcriptional regulator TrmB
MTTNSDAPETALAGLGFTDTEARVYCELVRAGPATGYRLAKAIGKAPANTYQALESLAQKGAVLTEDAEAKTWRAAPPAELLSALDAAHARRSAAALDALSRLPAAATDPRLYALRTPEQAYARARAMIAAARQIVLFDLSPAPWEALAPDLEKAQAAGVTVAGLLYRPAATSVTTVVSRSADVVLERWPGQQVTVVADAAEHLNALIAHDGQRLIQGVSSDSAFLACLQHSGLSAELRLSHLAPAQDPLTGISLLAQRPAGFLSLIGEAE